MKCVLTLKAKIQISLQNNASTVISYGVPQVPRLD